jgi:iron complex outermembrane receptor protein
VERNEFSGFELQPTARVRWSAGKRSVWGAVSRAVRVPSRFDTDLRFRLPGSATGLLLTGSPDFQSETVIAYEAGYRQQVRERLSIDIAAYANRYDDLRTQEVRSAAPVLLANMMNALSRGVETASTMQLAPRWQVTASHVYLWKTLSFDPGSRDVTRGTSEANDPRHIVQVRSYVNATTRIELDGFFRYVGALPSPAVDGYSEMDVRLGYRVSPGWDLSLIGNDLLHERHLEFRGGTPPETFERSVSLRSLWRF